MLPCWSGWLPTASGDGESIWNITIVEENITMYTNPGLCTSCLVVRQSYVANNKHQMNKSLGTYTESAILFILLYWHQSDLVLNICSHCFAIRTQIHLPIQKLPVYSVRASGNTTEKFARLWSRAGLRTKSLHPADIPSASCLMNCL